MNDPVFSSSTKAVCGLGDIDPESNGWRERVFFDAHGADGHATVRQRLPTGPRGADIFLVGIKATISSYSFF